MRYHVLACDYDGTIAHHGRVDDETVAALRRIRDTGRRLILVTAATCRTYSRSVRTWSCSTESLRKTAPSFTAQQRARKSFSASRRPNRLFARCGSVVCPRSRSDG